MSGDIQTLVVPGESGWRVAVATARYPDGEASVAMLPLIGWAKIVDPNVGVMWLPAWWDDLGMTTGHPGQIAWPLGPGVMLSSDLAEHLKEEASHDYRQDRTVT